MTDDPIVAEPGEAASVMLRHPEMMARSVQDGLSSPDVAAFVDDIVAAGRTTPPGPRRDRLRDILYFWAGDLANRGERMRDASLPALATFAGDAAPPSRAPELTPPPTARPSPVEGGAGVVAVQAEGSRILGKIESLVRRPTAPPPPPILDDAKERDARARSILRIAALARQWRVTADPDTKRGYLLTGRALAGASLYADEDADIRALLEASEQETKAAELRRRYVKGAFVTLLVLLLASLVVAGYLLEEQDKKRLSLELEEAQRLGAAGIARERGAVRGKARRALDALEINNVGPLKAFLQEIGDANPDELLRLRLDAPTSASSADAASQKTPQRAGPSAATRPAKTTATCRGFLWFGSKEDSRLAGDRDPASVKPGEVVILDTRSDLRLRADWPNQDTYVMSRQNGLVPAGAAVTVAGETRPFRRGQVWAEVSVQREYCTTAFLQFAGAASRTDAVLAVLHDLGVQTPPPEQIATASGLAEIRYFWPDDRAVSEEAATALRRALPGRTLKVLGLTDFSTRPPYGTIEVWLDLGG